LYNSEEESSRAGRAAPGFDWDAAKAGDGNLPGGVDPEALQKLTSSQEMMEIMNNPRLQVLLVGLGARNKDVPACYLHPLLLLAYSTTSIPLSFSFSQELMKAVMSKDSETMQNYIADAGP
jgi:hypothetical protein